MRAGTMAERPGDGGGAGEGRPASLAGAYEYYQNKLLSITGRNRSVQLRRIYTAHSCDLAELEGVTPGAAKRAASKAIRAALSARQVGTEHVVLSSSAGGDDADRFRGRLKTLARNLARIEEETGQQAGYMGFPFLVGHAAPGLYVRGPVALFPVSLVPRHNARAGGWSVQFLGQAPIVNSSLFMALKKRARHPVPSGYEEEFAALVEGMGDVKDALEGHLFTQIGDWLRRFLPMEPTNDPKLAVVAPVTKAGLDAMSTAEPLRLVNHKVVGSFPVADSKIYDDYSELIRRVDEPSHGLIAGLLNVPDGTGQGWGTGAPRTGWAAATAGYGAQQAQRPERGADRAADIDGAPSSSLNAVLPSDSSQDAVILESQRSNITVVRGPPGTGKSQVIVNLVSDALMRGEKVLVVCQKRAALEVVKQRLDEAGLGWYSVFLEREVDDRLRMYRHLCEIIESEPAAGGGEVEGRGIAEVDSEIDSHVKYLREFGVALHARLDGATAYDLYTRADGSYEAALDLDGVEGLPDWGGLEAYLGRMAGVEGAVRRFDDPASPWGGRKSFENLDNRDKGKIRDTVRRMHEACARSVLLGSREAQSRLVAVLGMCASAGRRPGRSMSAEIEDAIRIGTGVGGGGGVMDPAAAFCTKMAADAARAQDAASGGPAEEQRRAGEALAEFVEQYRVWEESSSLHRSAEDSMLVGGRREQEAFAAALESYVSRPGLDRAPTPPEIEAAIRIGTGAGAGADPAAAFRAKMAEDMARGPGRDAAGAADSASATAPADVAAALAEFAGLCASRARAEEMSRHAQGLLAGSLRDQEALVSALESYVADSSITRGKRKRAVREIAAAGLDPASLVGSGGGSAENARRSLEQARAGLEFWRLLSALPVPGGMEHFRPVIQAVEEGQSGAESALSEVKRSIEADMYANSLSVWAKHMMRAGAESAQDGPRSAHDSAAIARAYMDDPSPLQGASAAAAQREEGGRGGPDAADRRGALGEALGAALAGRRGMEATGPVPGMPDAARYRSLAESALSEFVALHRASECVRRLARLAPLCALARTPGGQARLPGLYEEARRGGVLAGKQRKRAAAEIDGIVAIPPADPERAAEASARGSEFWAAWPEAELAARGLGVAGSEAALEGRASLDSFLEALQSSIDNEMKKCPLAEWAKRLYRAGAEAVPAPGGECGPDAAGLSGRAAMDGLSSSCAALSRELCGGLAIVEPNGEDPVAVSTAEVNRYAAALAGQWIEPVRRGVKFWSAYSRLCAMAGFPQGSRGAAGPREVLEDILRVRDESCRRIVDSPLSEWAKALATSAGLRGDGGGDAGGGDAERCRAEAERIARLYLADPGLLASGRGADSGGEGGVGGGSAGAPPQGGAPDAANLLRLLLAELGRKGAPPELPALPDAGTAKLYETMIADALSSPGAGQTPAKWVGMIMECAMSGEPGRAGEPPDPRSIPAERASSPGFLELEASDPLHRMAAGMIGAAERIAAGALPAAEAGVRVWGALVDMGPFFDRGVAAAGSAAGAPAPTPAGIESFAAGAMSGLEGDALDDMQELDKKKSEYGPSMFKLLEMARARIGPGEGDWTATVRREVYAHWIDRIEQRHPVLRGKPIDNYNRHAEELAALAGAKRNLVVRAIRKKIESIRPRDVYGASQASFAGGDRAAWRAMLGELKKKRRVMPVRRLIERYSEQLFQIAPCWLASPESISKALPLKREMFDLVIVDEASQLAMERTLPFLYRGKRAVIAGDEKQLQPFDLFQTRADGEDDGEDAEAAETDRRYGERSLLDLAREKHMTTNLAWHYRSRHQGLIDFSNHAFYGGELNVVPDAHSDPARPPVQWIECDGRWIDRINAKEADEVVAQIRRTWGEAAKSGGNMPTVGVITFNEPQQNRILDRIDEARESDAEFDRLHGLAHKDGKKNAALFVKNIENVQGDERDVVIFSVGYARDDLGGFSNRFGSLNLKGGENRLNVAVTRARERMIVVSSIDPQIISASSEHDGPRRFRQFLEYARAVSNMDENAQKDVLARIDDEAGAGAAAGAGGRAAVAPDAADADALGVRIRGALEGAGYRVRTGLGFSGYRIDLAVVDPRDENRYAVGIEYDGPTFRSARSVMERDVVRPALLRAKGWAFERTWSRSWWKDPDAELARLRAKIVEAMMR